MADPSSVPVPSAAIGVGTWAWGNRFLWGYDPARDAELEATFRRALDLGLTFFDSADSYGTGRWTGRSELLLGRFCSALGPDQGQRVQVATKLAPFPWRLGRRGYRRAFEASRRRLNGHLQRVQLHWSTARYAPWQEGPLLDGLADLVLAGEVAELGVSNMGPRRLRQVVHHLAGRGVRLSSLQVQLSLLSPGPIAPGGVAAVCRELGVELIAYSPLALGLLARSGGESRPMPQGPRAALFRRLEPQLTPLLQRLAVIAAAHRAPLAAVALNWCRAHGAMPIVGLRSVAQAETAAEALRWQLSPEDRRDLDAIALALPRRMPANPFQSA
ncbi:aldo/keto reductase [Cyanobium sp. CH-040]|uniref:aldo/keto reductase n=1 Tax=Cyanobium sp. CH-040 TaxID=2823708 RepID=UPI0020CC7CBF|nr:aldo/keto reductase [Cyanobium sp. CH-040]MCP9929034.1 aldo/keto reductase [Cyanobium sp. CH-040]